MAFKSNIRAFYNHSKSHPLLDSYRLLVALELALKDANYVAHCGSHDVPNMLVTASNSLSVAAFPLVSAQLKSYSAKLRSDLGSITCQGKNSLPTPVPPSSYPYIRYSRCFGDWSGINETPAHKLTTLETTCRSICAFITAHSVQIGVFL